MVKIDVKDWPENVHRGERAVQSHDSSSSLDLGNRSQMLYAIVERKKNHAITTDFSEWLFIPVQAPCTFNILSPNPGTSLVLVVTMLYYNLLLACTHSLEITYSANFLIC